MAEVLNPDLPAVVSVFAGRVADTMSGSDATDERLLVNAARLTTRGITLGQCDIEYFSGR